MRNKSSSTANQFYWPPLLIFVLCVAGLFFTLLGTRPLWVPDEGRYAEIIREMLVTQNFITPHLNGIKYFEKPILFYWLGYVVVKFAGLSIWSLRSINAFLAIGGCLMTYAVGCKWYTRQTGLLAASILATSVLYFAMAHVINLDLTVTFFLTACLYASLLAFEATGGKQCHYLLLAAVASALAVLTKGLIGIFLPALIVGFWSLTTQRLKQLSPRYIATAALTFFAIVLPWHIIVSRENPEFFNFYFIQQHFLRYTTTSIGHTQPMWFFVPYLIIGFFPWIMFLPQTLFNTLSRFKHFHEHYKEFYLVCWIAIIFTFFSFSKSKLIPYILPIFPPLALLTAHQLQRLIQQKKCLPLQLSIAGLILSGFFFLAFFSQLPRWFSLIKIYQAQNDLLLGSGIFLLGNCFAFHYSFRDLTKSLYLIVFSSGLFLLIVLSSIPWLDTKTVQPLAFLLKPYLQPHDEVITFNQYYQDLPFYLQRRITVLNWKNELSFGMLHQDTHEWMINDAAFWQRIQEKKRIFIFINKAEYPNLLQHSPHQTWYVLGRTPNTFLISTQELGKN